MTNALSAARPPTGFRTLHQTVYYGARSHPSATANDAGSHRAGNGEDRMKICIKRFDNAILTECEPKNFLAGGRCHPDLPDMDAIVSEVA
jgi:hypothetical protein